MVKSRKYSVRICLTSGSNMHTVYCVCPAGLAGCCNHVAALLYALEEFVRLGLREESRLVQVVCSNGTDIGAEMFHQNELWMLQ